MKFAALAYCTDSFCLKIFPAGEFNRVNWKHIDYSDEGLKFFSFLPEHSINKAFVEYAKDDEYNIEPLHLKETVRYKCVIEAINNSVAQFKLELQNKNNKFLNYEKDDNKSIAFQFINYLGKSTLLITPQYKLSFEIVPDKITYKDDYVNLTNAIAEECASLLLDYSSPTTHSFSLDFEKQHETALEQFIFLRQFCYAENLKSLFGSIKRNPDRKLVSENEMKPFGTGMVSRKFYTNPFSYANEWNDLGDGIYLPSKIATTRKYDSFDTPANRFLKFALNAFLDICECIEQRVDSNSTFFAETKILKGRIEDILQDSFFDDVMDLTIMPSNNQVLEKREGYAQIFNAFSMMDLALKLNWKGRVDAYSGEAKNTALLYEYWLFFELRKIIKSIASCKRIDVDDEKEPFVTDKDGLTIVLQQGFKSVEHFEVNDLKIDLYYNYTFYPKDFKSTKYEGSYSRPFRPDYTIAIFPGIYKKEHDAIEAGEVRYIHFDAKYRLEDLTQFVNKDISELIEEEKNDSVMNTYKRGDLLKMHTYNDAIRSTVGSYVLYPGNANDKTQFCVYEEILPGVGAFALRPGNVDTGERAVQTFIQDVISFCDNPASRLARTGYFEKMISETPSEGKKPIQAENTKPELFMLGFLRDEYHDWLIENRFIPNGGEGTQFTPFNKEVYFYYHAIRDGHVYPLHKDISKAKYFCARSKGDYAGETEVSKFNIDPWMAEIESTELVSAKDLASRLEKLNNGNGFIPKKKYSAEFYYLVKLKNIQSANFSRNSFEELDSGNLAISAYSPKIAQRVK